MSEQRTEIALLPIAADVDLTSGDSGRIWNETLSKIISQPGALAIHWGRQIEHPEIVQLVIDWESLQHHKDFMASPAYGPFTKQLEALLSGPIHLCHIQLPSDPSFGTVAAAPVVECLSLFLDPSHDQAAYEANFASFKSEGEKTAKDAQGLTGGWGVEEQQHESFGAKEGEKGPAKLFAAFIGWPSVEAHLQYRQTEQFPGVIKYLRDGPKAVQVCHVKFQKFA